MRMPFSDLRSLYMKTSKKHSPEDEWMPQASENVQSSLMASLPHQCISGLGLWLHQNYMLY